jgi:hypothetical protein
MLQKILEKGPKKYKYKNRQQIYINPKRQLYNKQIPVKNYYTKTKRTINQQDIIQ